MVHYQGLPHGALPLKKIILPETLSKRSILPKLQGVGNKYDGLVKHLKVAGATQYISKLPG
jgi:hypothetical protein